MIETISAGGVIIGPSKKIVIVNQDGMTWSLPKGKLEENEDIKAAALREIKEESGLTQLKLIKELGTYKRYKMTKSGGDDKSELKTITFFLYTTAEEKLRPIDPDNPEARWVEPDKVADMLTHPKDKEFFRQISDELEYLS